MTFLAENRYYTQQELEQVLAQCLHRARERAAIVANDSVGGIHFKITGYIVNSTTQSQLVLLDMEWTELPK